MDDHWLACLKFALGNLIRNNDFFTFIFCIHTNSNLRDIYTKNYFQLQYTEQRCLHI